jgi:mannose-6-phosphate isomerase-like protein (cupin superfamily)
MPATVYPKAARPELVCALDVQAAALTEDGLDRLAAPSEAEQYRRLTLHRDDAIEVATARWRSGGASSLHGHGVAQAAYRVLYGIIEEERYLPTGNGYRYERVRLRAGDTTTLPPGAYHRVHAVEEAITVHAYSPAPESCTEAVSPDTQRLLDGGGG